MFSFATHRVRHVGCARVYAHAWKRFHRTGAQRNKGGTRLILGVVGAGAIVYFWNVERLEQSGRRRFIITSDKLERRMGESEAKRTKTKYANRILPPNDKRTQVVRRVGTRIAAASGRRDLSWEFTVIDDPTINAFVLPGGHVFVFTGLLSILPNEDALATVLAHEAAHAILRHAGEKISYHGVFLLVYFLVYAFTGVDVYHIGRAGFNLVVSLPNSRLLESEADKVGLALMTEACFDPTVAPKTFARLHNHSSSGGNGVKFLSTHPTDEKRIADLNKELEAGRYLQHYRDRCVINPESL